MSNETNVVCKFFTEAAKKSEGHNLILLKTDNSVQCISATDPEALFKLSNITANYNPYLAWKVFNTDAEAQIFLTRLKCLNETTVASAHQVCPVTPGTLSDEALGRMMHREDVQVETYAAEEAANKEAEECAAGTFNYAASTMPDSKPPAARDVKPPSSSSQRASVPSFGLGAPSVQNPYAKGSNGIQGNPDIVDPALGMFDMTKVPLNFDKTGNATGAPLGTELRVSAGFPIKGANAKIYIVCLFKHRGNLWALDAKFMQYLYAPFIKNQFHDIESAPLYLQTLKDYPICNRVNPNKFARSKKGYTQNKPMFVLRVPNGGAKVDSYLTAAFNTLSSYFKQSSEPPIGKVFVDWLASNKESAYNHLVGETSNMKKITHDALVQQMHTKLVNAFAKKIVDYNVPLNSLLTYGHIKELFVGFCGYEGWSDVPHELKSSVVKDFPRNAMPDWHSITMDEY